MSTIYNSITELIGNTPIIKLNRIVPEGAADVYVKVEAFNPGSSVKDRIALAMIEDAEERGIIKPGDTIVEATSGNTGIGLSWVGSAKGYKVVITMPDTMSIERRKIIQAYGAELVLTPGNEGTKGAIIKAQEIAKERNGFIPSQFENQANPAIHEKTTGQEILKAFGEDGLDAFVAGVGTGGTITGVSRALKKQIQTSKSTLLKQTSLLSSLVSNLGHTKSKVSLLALCQTHLTPMLMTKSSVSSLMTP